MSARVTAVAASGLLGLAACSPSDRSAQTEAVASSTDSGTVAAALTEIADHRMLSAALTDTQLAPVLDGNGHYTLLAPSDAAFDALGEKGTALGSEEQRPLMIAVLRGHILPGQVTSRSVEEAIARKKGPVEMRTMAGDTVRFAQTDEGLTVSNGNQTAKLEAGEVTAANGAVLPIDKVLLPAS